MTRRDDPSAYPVWANGAIHGARTPVVAAEDLGLLLGLSVYDTLLLEQGCIYFLEEHVERLRASCACAGIAWPLPWDPRSALVETARALEGRDAALRITVTRGVGAVPSVIVTPRALERAPEEGVSVFVTGHAKLAGAPLEELKSTNRLRNVLAREEAQRLGAFEAIFLTHEGDLTEGSVSNLWIVFDDEIATPPTARGLLAGIVRGILLDSLERTVFTGEHGVTLPTRVRRIDARELAKAREVFLSNTTGRVIPVRRVLGLSFSLRELPPGAGPVARALRQRLAEIEARDRAGFFSAWPFLPAPRPAPPEAARISRPDDPRQVSLP